MMSLTARSALADRSAAADRVLPSVLERIGQDRPLRVLVFTSLFPSDVRPRHGIFVETRLAQLVKDCPVDARVVAPIPWFPWASPRFGEYALFAATPRRATRPSGLMVSYPRYPMIPKVGVTLQPASMARAAWGDIVELMQSGWQPDLIDAHYLYPDGVAAARLSRRLRIPLVMTARGTDVNVLARMAGAGRRIADAARQATAIVAVSSQLRAGLVSIGVDERKIHVLRNGVDLGVFSLVDRSAARARLGLPGDGLLLATVGNLRPEKGQALAIEVLQHLVGAKLLVVGDGPLRAELAAYASRSGTADRVIFRNAMPQRELRDAYAAADVLLVTSTREGWPNVVLESLACGTPVASVEVGAVGEMISGQAGRIVSERSAAMLASAVCELVGADREELRRHAARFDWMSISHEQWRIFTQAIAGAADSRRRTV